MKFNPHPYQEQIIDQMESLPRSNVWAGMGMGKTSATLMAINRMQLRGEVTSPVLVLGPRRVIAETWPSEAKKWDNLSGFEVVPILGTPERRAELLGTDAPVHAINYDQLPWLVSWWGDRWPYQMVVADEATRLKGMRLGGSKATRAKAIARVAHTRVVRWVNLTGTPSPNGFIDLWGQQWFVDRGLRLGRTFGAYEDRWFMKPVRGGTFSRAKLLPFAQQQIEDRLRDCTVSIRPEDHFDVSAPIFVQVKVKLPPKARAVYTDVEKRMFAELDGQQIEAFNIATKFNKLLQIASGAVYTDEKGTYSEIHTAKIEALQSLLHELGGANLLVAYEYRHDLVRLRDAFPKAKTLDDNGALAEWNAGRVGMLLVHPASAGHGLNLQQGGHHLAFFSQGWNYEHRAQVIERIGPMRQRQSGFDRPVWVYDLIAEGTLDELALARKANKAEEQENLLAALVQWKKDRAL